MNCIDALPEVFKPGLSPWVDMQASDTDKIMEAVETCPTAAIRWKFNKDIKPNTTPDNSINPEGKSEREEV